MWHGRQGVFAFKYMPNIRLSGSKRAWWLHQRSTTDIVLVESEFSWVESSKSYVNISNAQALWVSRMQQLTCAFRDFSSTQISSHPPYADTYHQTTSRYKQVKIYSELVRNLPVFFRLIEEQLKIPQNLRKGCINRTIAQSSAVANSVQI